MIRIFLVFLVLISTTAAQAQDEPSDPWYQVEVIVFEHAGATHAEPGDWPTAVDVPALGRAVELLPPLEGDADAAADEAADMTFDAAAGEPLPATPVHISGTPAFRLLTDPELRMTAVMNRLLVSSAYTPLVHLAWRQPATTAADFGGVRIHSGSGVAAGESERPEEESSAAAVADPAAAAAPDADPDASAKEPGEATPAEGIDGIVRLGRGRFLHLNVDLLYRRQGLVPETGAGLFGFRATPRPRTEVLRLTQSRRIRADELQYIDHPRFGAIVLVTPFAPLPETDGAS